MALRQMAFVLWFQDDESSNIHVLNGLLTNGWRIVHTTPMSGTGEQRGIGNAPESRCLLLLEHGGPSAAPSGGG
jgi:hypothetical protein